MSLREPLFIRFANGKMNEKQLLGVFESGCQDDNTRRIVEEKFAVEFDLSVFRGDFVNALKDLIDNGADHYFVNYVNSYMKPSLEEFVEEAAHQGTGMEKRWVSVKDAEAPWVEALVCYNLCVYIKAYSVNTIKACKTCQRFFTHKGKYATYCSEACKTQGTPQR